MTATAGGVAEMGSFGDNDVGTRTAMSEEYGSGLR